MRECDYIDKKRKDDSNKRFKIYQRIILKR